MAINLTDSWNGENLSDIREFIQAQLKKGFINVTTTVANGKVVLTFTKADGTTTKAEFTAAEGQVTEGYRATFRLIRLKKVYASGEQVKFNYEFEHFYDGEELFGVNPNINIAVYSATSTGTIIKQLYSTISTSTGINTITIPSSSLKDVEGIILVKASYTVEYQGQAYTGEKSITISISNCSIEFGSGFNLSDQVKGYDTTAGLQNVFVNYSGSNNADLLVYIDGVLRKTIAGISTGQVSVDFAMNAVDDHGETILSIGIHCMQLVAKMDTNTVDENGQPVYIYSNSLVFDFYKGLSGSHVGIQMTLDSYDIITDPINSLLIETQQYINTDISYAASSYSTSDGYLAETAVSVSKDGTVISNLAVSPTSVYTYTFRDVTIGSYGLLFSTSTSNRKVNINTIANSSGVSVASGANIDISASGRNNKENASVIDTWVFRDNAGNSYNGVLSNFTHKETALTVIDGWDGEGLIFRGSTELNIPYKPFSNFSVNTGYYIEFNFKVDTILDSNDYIIKCLDSENKGGFYLKAEEAGMITNNGIVVSTPFSAGTYYNIGFMIKSYKGKAYTNSTGSIVDNTNRTTILLELYVNGVRSGVVEFSSYDSFNPDATIYMDGRGAIWKFIGMRVYNTTLSPTAIFNNWLTTLTDGDEILKIANNNNILNTAKTDIDSAKLLALGKNVMIIYLGDGEETVSLDEDGLGKLTSECTGTVSETRVITTKASFLAPSAKKKDNFLAKAVEYYNNGNINDDYSFKIGPTLFQVQGTSSTYYSRKNYDIFFTGQKYVKKGSNASSKVWTSKFDENVGKSHTYEGGLKTAPRYSMSSEDQGVPCLCLKADYSDSSNLHNTVLTKMVNDVWKTLGTNFMTPPQHNNDTIYDNVRVGINGHPIDVFIKDGTGVEQYIGQYNMNNEKKDSHHVYGFTAGSGNPSVGSAICVEFLENNKPATLFNTTESFDWDNCSSSVDDKGEAIPELEFRYPSNDWVDGSAEEKAAVKRVFTWVYDCYVHWNSSYNEITGQYTSTKFVEELTQYFNPHNLCAWYLYTDYFLAVDQRSKNMMLASWDKNIWYFLPYDSDTALGVTNDGWLIIPYDSDENTKNPKDDSQYAFMGHDSNLWKLVRYYLLDDTFTSNPSYNLQGCNLSEIAQTLRKEVSSNKLFNMTNVLNCFAKSRNYWSEQSYNFDADTKYIAPLTYQSDRGSKSNFAQFIQGSRDAHRAWLLNKRFRLLDAKYTAGYYETDVHSPYLSIDYNEDISLIKTVNIKVIANHTTYVRLGKNTLATTLVRKKIEKDVETDLTIQGTSFGTNDPFFMQGFSVMKSIDFDTMAPNMYSAWTFPASWTYLERLIMDCPNNDGVLQGNNINLVASLINLKEFVFKGYPNVTGILDLSNNILLETVDIDCENLSDIVMPYSTFNIKKFNVGKLNITVPWEFWNELNDYYTRTQNSCIFVGELVDRNLTYTVYAGNGTAGYIVSGKYFVYVLPYTGLGFDGNNNGIFGANSTTRNQVNLKRIIYAKVDSSLFLRTTDSMGMGKLYAGCSNLISINTKGWNCDFTRNQYNRNVWFGNIMDHCPCSEIDLSFIKTGYFTNNTNTIAASLDAFTNLADTVTYIKYGTGWFNLTVVSKNRNTATTICTSSNMNAQHYIDLAEDLPDVTSLDLTEIARTLKIGDNFNNYDKFPQTVRDKILAKGWLITQ